MTAAPFGARLVGDAMAARGPLCVGIDPHPQLLADGGCRTARPGSRRSRPPRSKRWPVRSPSSSRSRPSSRCTAARGIAVLEQVVAESQRAGALVLLDVKRGDIGSTMDAYARAYLADGAPLAADAITVSPYLGFGSLGPAVDLALSSGRGLFVLGVTSNPEAPQVQYATTGSGRLVAQTVVDEVAALNAGMTPLGSIGLVVGATVGATPIDLSAANGPFLAPGLGAQGGTAAGLRAVFGDNLPAVLPSSSGRLSRPALMWPPCGRPRCGSATSSQPCWAELPGGLVSEASVARSPGFRVRRAVLTSRRPAQHL